MNDSKQIDDGGPAFPRPGFTTGLNHGPFVDAGFANCHQQGMTLRDWFAATIALTPTELDLIMSRTGSEQHAEEVLLRYQKADATLAARKERV